MNTSNFRVSARWLLAFRTMDEDAWFQLFGDAFRIPREGVAAVRSNLGTASLLIASAVEQTYSSPLALPLCSVLEA